MKKNHIPIVVILGLALIVRIYYFFDYHEVWWDSAVYIGMGKYIFSLGQAGLWEHIRPVLWPVVLGVAWFMKLDVLITGRIVQLLLSLGIIYLVYDSTRSLFSERAAIVAAAVFSFSSVFFFMGYHLYTEIPSIFFLLLSIFFIFRNRIFWSGMILGLSVLTKFTMLVFVPAFLLYFLFSRDWFRRMVYLGLGSSAVLVPFMAFNKLMYDSFILPFTEAHDIILRVVGCNYLYYKPWYYYLQALLQENYLYLLVPLGIVMSLKAMSRERFFLLMCLVVPLVYFSQLHCRDYRYLVTFLPFLAIYSGFSIDVLAKRLRKRWFLTLVFCILIVSAWIGIGFYKENTVQPESVVSREYFSFLEGKNISKEVWVSNPIVGIYTDERIHTLYYPVFDQHLALRFYEYVQNNHEEIGYVFLDSCGGGIICPPDDTVCVQRLSQLIGLLKERLMLVYYKEHEGCTYYLFAEAT
jgi:4-amino-4-deoxy-L-arabinose transferase-like glycosyltransferase